MAEILWAAIWTALLLASFCGWGRALGAVVSRARALGAGERAALGASFLVFAAGVLEHTGAFRATTVVLVAAAGAVVELAGLVRSRRLRNGLGPWGLVTALFACAVGLSWIASPGLNPIDDFPAYLAFPIRLLETGAHGADPFSLRRMLSLGGQTTLFAFLLAPGLDVSHVALMEPALPAVGLVLLVAGHGRASGLKTGVFLLCVALVAFAPLPRQNISTLMAGAWLTYALLLAVSLAPANAAAGVAVGLLAAALTALKSSFLLPALAAVGVFCLLELLGPGRSRRAAFAAAATFVVALAPWCVASYRSNGTALYPLLGAGWHGSAYGVFPLLEHGADAGSLRRALLAQTPLLGVLVAALVSWGRRPWRRELFLLGAMVPACVVMGAVTLPRHAFGASFACALFGVVAILGGRETASPGTVMRPSLPAGIAVGLLLFPCVDPEVTAPRTLSIGRIFSVLSRPARPVLDGDEERASAARAQSVVPPGERILARVTRPDQLDFARNDVWLVDWPGGASPPPGLRVDAGATSVAASLRAAGVRWILYSWAAQAGFERDRYRSWLAPGVGLWKRESTRQALRFQDELLELAETHCAHRDDRILVLDLSAAGKACPPAPPDPRD